MNQKYTKEILSPIVAKSYCVTDVLRNLKFDRISGGLHKHITNLIRKFELDTTHFELNRKNKSHTNRTHHWREILVKNRNNNKRESSLRLRRCMIEYGFKYECKLCGQKPFWNGIELRIEIDHINNDPLDNEPVNLRFLCPNCHSQQKHKMNRGFTLVTTCNRPSSKRQRSSKQKTNQNKQPKQCNNCTQVIDNRSKICKKCDLKKRTDFEKIDWPDLDELILMVSKSNFVKVGEMLGVSDNAIRKRIIKMTKKNGPMVKQEDTGDLNPPT